MERLALPASISTAIATVALAALLARWPRTYECGAHSRCRGWTHGFARRTWIHATPDLGFRETRRVALARSLERRRRSGGRPIALGAGASDLSMDAAEYLELLPDASRWRFVFVEPLGWLLPALRETAQKWAHREQVHVVEALVCDGNASSQKLHTVPLKSIEELGLGFMKREISHLSSMDKSATRRGIRESVVIPEPLKLRLDGKLRAVPVRCVTPASVLEEVQAPPGDLELLFLDTEGRDVDVLRQFLAMEGFAPTMVKLKWINMEHRWRELTDAVQALASRGYHVRQEHFDLVAVSSKLL